MADETTEVKDKAAAAVGADPERDTSESETTTGNPAPPPPSNEPPADDTPEEAEDTTEGAEDTSEDAGEEDNSEDGEDKALDTDVWGTTGDEVGDAALTLIQNAGLTTDEAKAFLFDAVTEGDITKVDKDALTEKVGKDKATLILAGVENYVARSKAKAETIVQECHTAVGGEDNWNAVTTWAKENVSSEDMADYVDLIDAGGAKARFAAQELAARYNGDAKNTTLNADTAEIVGDSKAQTSARAISKAAYVAELEAAHASGASEAVINEINAARARGRAKGI